MYIYENSQTGLHDQLTVIIVTVEALSFKHNYKMQIVGGHVFTIKSYFIIIPVCHKTLQLVFVLHITFLNLTVLMLMFSGEHSEFPHNSRQANSTQL